MHFIGAYDSHHPFVFSAEDQIISDERKIKELVARDLEIDLEILEIPEENATEEIALKQGIIEWCKETWEQDGYQARKLAAEAILECYLNKEEELDLESLKIGSLPESFYLPHLKRLDLGSRDLQSWPMYFNLINLEELDLHNNPLNSESFDAHSQWIGVLSVLNILNNHPNLKKLILDDNGLDVLPENLRFPKLVHLSMNRNWITTLPGNWDIPELQKLYLEDNALVSFPENLSYRKLKTLKLNHNPNLRELTEGLLHCYQLEKIEVNGTEIPEAAVQLILTEKNAQQDVDLLQGVAKWTMEVKGQDRWEARKSAMNAIRKCCKNKEEELDLSGWDIGSLPENFYLPHLKSLKLSGCELESWSTNFNLINLKKLDAAQNQLPSESLLVISNGLPNLEKLVLDNNGLEVLPENLSFPKLVRLSINENWLTTLPRSLCVPELKKLFLIGNDLTSLPDNSPYPKLEKLSLEDNPNLEELPISLAYCEQLEEIQSEFLQEAIKCIFTKKKELNYGVKVAQMLGELNGYFDHEGNYDLKLPLEMIGDIAELGTIHGEPGEYWNRAVILAEETELETFDRKENAASSSSLAGSLKRKREEEL